MLIKVRVGVVLALCTFSTGFVKKRRKWDSSCNIYVHILEISTGLNPARCLGLMVASGTKGSEEKFFFWLMKCLTDY